MPRVDLTTVAQFDLKEIWTYIAQDSEFQADRLLSRFWEKFHYLARFNTVGQPRPELSKNCRSFPFGKYCFYFRPHEDGILILRILHSARDLEQMAFPE
jgi:toxin ParE1/3/4